MRRSLSAVVAALVVAAAVVAFAGPAAGHTLDSSTVTVEVDEGTTTAVVSLPVATLDQAFDADRRSDVLDAEPYATQVMAYVAEHLAIGDAEGEPWSEAVTAVERHTVEGIETVTIGFDFDHAGSADGITVTYDAVVEAVADHQAVLVLVDHDVVSTPGVFTTSHRTVTVDAATDPVAFGAMVGLGLHHVLDGADHLLFLFLLLLPAPLVMRDRRWEPGTGPLASLRRVAHVATAFTVGHGATLAATALGWIAVPSRIVEIGVAASVGVAAIHVIRPLVHRGETLIAGVFGLVHGMAFAGILADLGLDRNTSVVALFAFDIGIELAQLAVIACVFPSLHLLATRRSYPAVRVASATLALTVATAWIVDRMGLVADPLASGEQAFVDDLWPLAAALAIVAVAVHRLDRPTAGVDRRR